MYEVGSHQVHTGVDHHVNSNVWQPEPVTILLHNVFVLNNVAILLSHAKTAIY